VLGACHRTRDAVDNAVVIVGASVVRLRPVMMASITTALGMIPLFTDAFFVAMAVTITSGLLFATVLTMIVVPVLYAILVGATNVALAVVVGIGYWRRRRHSAKAFSREIRSATRFIGLLARPRPDMRIRG
jgi:predicted RND superfamily exporter protein